MKLAIMQPYFFPYIGYFQLMNAVDEFVVYDNIEFSKGWVNRNRILVNGKEAFITVPLKKDSDFLAIGERSLAESWPIERKKMLNRITETYRKAPQFRQVYPLVEKVILFEENNLFRFMLNSLTALKDYLEIKASLTVSSSVNIDHSLKSHDKVLAICHKMKATEYLNPIGGLRLYDRNDFKREGVNLFFLRAQDITYTQFDNQFVPSLSVIDLLMFNQKSVAIDMLNLFTLE